MASGLPVIAVGAGGVMDSVIPEYNGLLCEPRNSESLRRGMERFLREPNLINVMGLNAKKYARTRTWQHVFNQLISDYASVLPAYEAQASIL